MSGVSKDTQDKLYSAFKSVNEGMEAHLIESIISLFHQGVLKHYVRSYKCNLDTDNFLMTVEAANGVKFEGREKIVEQEKEIESLKARNKKLRESVINLIHHFYKQGLQEEDFAIVMEVQKALACLEAIDNK